MPATCVSGAVHNQQTASALSVRTQPNSMVIYAPVGDNDEPRFMAPTASASERWQSSVTISDSLVPDASQLPPPPPEWAAPIR